MSKVKTIEITQKDLDKKIGDSRKEAFEMGLRHGRSEMLPYRKNRAVKGIILLDALCDFFDERYELIKEDY